MKTRSVRRIFCCPTNYLGQIHWQKSPNCNFNLNYVNRQGNRKYLLYKQAGLNDTLNLGLPFSKNKYTGTKQIFFHPARASVCVCVRDKNLLRVPPLKDFSRLSQWPQSIFRLLLRTCQFNKLLYISKLLF